MNKITHTILAAIFGLFAVMAVHADDIDIYLKTDEIRASPPYLMFMVDYRPSVFSTGCGTVANCYNELSTKAFIQLCIGRAASNTLTLNQKKALCTRYANDIADDGYANYSTY